MPLRWARYPKTLLSEIEGGKEEDVGVVSLLLDRGADNIIIIDGAALDMAAYMDRGADINLYMRVACMELTARLHPRDI